MLGSDSQISKIYRKMRIRPHNKIWGCIHKYLYIIEKCVFVPKRKYLTINTDKLLDRLAYCEPPPSGGKQCGSMLQ